MSCSSGGLMGLLGSTSLSAHDGWMWFGGTIMPSWLRRDAWRARCKFIDMNTHRDCSVSCDVGTAGQATLGVRWRSNVTATERRRFLAGSFMDGFMDILFVHEPLVFLILTPIVQSGHAFCKGRNVV